MTARKKTIKKPSFVITYVISLLIVVLLLSGIGAVVYNSERSKYDERVRVGLTDCSNDIESEIYRVLKKNKDDITAADIVWLKWCLANYYIETDQYLEVYYDNEKIADAKSSIYLTYNVSSEDASSGFKYYKLEIADDKYFNYFNTPELKKYRFEGYSDEPDLFSGGSTRDGFRTHPYSVEFLCDEFYADLNNCKFIPVESRVITYPVELDKPEKWVEVRITPDPKDIEGYTLVKINEGSEDSAYGTMAGLEGQRPADADLIKVDALGYENKLDNNRYYKKTLWYLMEFEEACSSYIKYGVAILILSAFAIALIPATIRYNINKRNYDIFQYRLKTTNAMAHDLKTPLASIIAYAEILNNNIDADNREHYLTKISDTASKMNSIVNSILQFSRSENAEVPVNKSEVSAPELIAAVINENEQQINEKGLTTDFDSSEELKLNTDKELLHQALGNLINNAAKYAKEGTIVRINYDEEMISITNETAETIEDITNIKDPFIKGNSSRQNGGTGLGLAIANNDLAMLGYKLDIRCEGDVFTATIKLRK